MVLPQVGHESGGGTTPAEARCERCAAVGDVELFDGGFGALWSRCRFLRRLSLDCVPIEGACACLGGMPCLPVERCKKGIIIVVQHVHHHRALICYYICAFSLRPVAMDCHKAF